MKQGMLGGARLGRHVLRLHAQQRGRLHRAAEHLGAEVGVAPVRQVEVHAAEARLVLLGQPAWTGALGFRASGFLETCCWTSDPPPSAMAAG